MSNIKRWPTAVVIIALLVALIVGDRSAERSSAQSTESTLGASPASVNSLDALSSTWYCAGGTASADGQANHSVVVANPTGRDMTVKVTAYPVVVEQYELPEVDEENVAELAVPAPQADLRAPVSTTIELDARMVQQIDLIDLVGNEAGQHAAALVEADSGGLVVTHAVAGDRGVATAACHTEAANQWTMASGTTRRGARQFVTLFNPFPSNAVVDITFAVDGRDRGRAPQVYKKIVVPAASVLPVEITGVVTLFDSVSTNVNVLSGRVVVDRIVDLEAPESGGPGISLAPGSGSLAGEWVFGISHAEGAGIDAVVVHNPSPDREARVTVEVYLDQPSVNGTIEPFGITVRPQSTELVVLGFPTELVAQSRVFNGGSRLPDGVGYWAAVRVLNNVDVVADRAVISQSGDIGTSFAPGVTHTATLQYLALPGPGSVSGELVVVNPAQDAIATVTVSARMDGRAFSITSFEVAPGGRTLTSMDDWGVPEGAVLVFETTLPTVIEADVSIGGSPRVAVAAVPAADSAVDPDLPLY